MEKLSPSINLKVDTTSNFDKNYPNEPLTLLIWDEKISLMSNNTNPIPSPESIVGQDICVTGKISKYKRHYQITPNSKNYLS